MVTAAHAGETVKVLSKTTKIDTQQQKICYNLLIVRCQHQNSARILNTFTVSIAKAQ